MMTRARSRPTRSSSALHPARPVRWRRTAAGGATAAPTTPRPP